MAVSDKINQYDEQMSILRKHKMALLTRPFMGFLFSLLEQPLRRLRSGGEGNDIEEQDVQTVELVLALVRNILLIPDAPRGIGSTLQDTLVSLFYDECILDALLIIIGISEDHKQWSLVLLDIIYFLFRGETPDSLWNERTSPSSTVPASVQLLSSSSSLLSATSSNSAASSLGVGSTASQLLAQKLRVEASVMQRKKGLLLNRPPRFYKPFVVNELDGRFLVAGTSIPDSGPISCASPSKPSRPGVVVSKHRMTKVADVPTSEGTRSAPRTRAILREYAGRFLESGYPILLRTVTDFIKTSPEDVLPSDSLNRLWLVYFFTSFHFLRENEMCKLDPGHAVDIAPVAGSMDVESFTAVVAFIEKFDLSEAAPSKTAVATAILALCELLRILLLMVTQKDGTEMHEMGVALALNLFHDTSLLLNRVPTMIARYSPKTRTIKELEALVEVADVLMEVVKAVIQSGTEIFVQSKRAMVFLDKAKKDAKVLFKDSNEDVPNEDEESNSGNKNSVSAANAEKDENSGTKAPEKDSGSESEYEDVYVGHNETDNTVTTETVSQEKSEAETAPNAAVEPASKGGNEEEESQKPEASGDADVEMSVNDSTQAQPAEKDGSSTGSVNDSSKGSDEPPSVPDNDTHENAIQPQGKENEIAPKNVDEGEQQQQHQQEQSQVENEKANPNDDDAYEYIRRRVYDEEENEEEYGNGNESADEEPESILRVKKTKQNKKLVHRYNIFFFFFSLSLSL